MDKEPSVSNVNSEIKRFGNLSKIFRVAEALAYTSSALNIVLAVTEPLDETPSAGAFAKNFAEGVLFFAGARVANGRARVHENIESQLRASQIIEALPVANIAVPLDMESAVDAARLMKSQVSASEPAVCQATNLGSR